MLQSRLVPPLLFAMLVTLLPPVPAHAQSANSGAYNAETAQWRAAARQFAGWERDGVSLSTSGALQLDPQKARTGTDPYAPGRYSGGNFYNGGSFIMGEATGPVATPRFPFSEAIPSWNADTPAGTWVEVQLRARIGTQWTKWYNMGVWASGQETVKRHSVSGQTDANGTVDIDTLKLGRQSRPLTGNAYQLKVKLFTANRGVTPSLHNAAVAVSTRPSAPVSLAPGSPARWNKLLEIPECSQMVYRDGGEVWCSPTSLSMVLAYWDTDQLSCEARVRAAVSGVYDRIYRGHGNWPFNAAYAATQDLEAYVTRFTSMSEAEEWIAAGVPVIFSFGWGRRQLSGAPLPASSGHLAVLVGFDNSGNPIVNDPAASSNEAAQRTYRRAELERLWLQRSGGTVYLVYPAGKGVPRL